MLTTWKNGKYQPLVKYVTLKDLKKLSNAIDIINGDSDTKGSIKKAIKDLVGEAPEAYDTLKEIADKLKSDDDLHKALNDAIILKASSDALNAEINRATEAETTLTTNLNAELNKKFDKSSIVQESGEAEDKVMSQKAVSDKFNELITTSNQLFSDLDFSDEDGYVLVRFQDGGIKTKNFDSSKDATEEERGLMSSVDKTKINGIEEGAQVNDVIIADVGGADLDFSDDKGNTVMRVANGHIKTKNFDSSEIHTNPPQAMSISLSGIYNRDNPFGVDPNIVYKDAAKRTLPNNVIPLIVIAGQSNADGRAPYNTASNWESTKWLADANYSVENYNMQKASAKTFETYNVLTNNGAGSNSGSDGSGDNKFSFDPFFAKKFIEVFNTPLYAVRETLGGIGIEDYVVRAGKKNTWQPKIGYIENKYSVTDVNYLILRLLEKINDIKEWCNNNNKILFPIAILWHQGEHDADASLITSFKENTSEVISFMRGIFQAPALPFINGFVQKDYNANYAKVNQIFLELNEIDDYMKTVDMAGHYTSIGDGLHYDGQSLAYMGEQMFNYYKQLNSLI